MLEPHFPGVFGDVLVDALADFALPGNTIEAGEVASKFDAVHDAFVVTRGLLRSWRWNVVHEILLSLVAKSYKTKILHSPAKFQPMAEMKPRSDWKHPMRG